MLQAWDAVLAATSGKWNVMALDLKNEPHDPATWGKEDADTDWNKVWTSGYAREGERRVGESGYKHRAGGKRGVGNRFHCVCMVYACA